MIEECKYCSGKGEYTTESWGIKEKHLCRFCGGKGVMDNGKKETN